MPRFRRSFSNLGLVPLGKKAKKKIQYIYWPAKQDER